jgi:hypothetical protein
MLRSMHAVAFAMLTLVACAQTSQSPPTTTAPVVSATAAPDPTVAATAPVAASVSSAAPAQAPAPAASVAAEPAPGDASAGVGTQFRACKSDTDCVAVPRAGCCDNGWKEAVAASQKDAYAQANACTRQRPICPMYKVRDRRVPYCDLQPHLCSMKQP